MTTFLLLKSNFTQIPHQKTHFPTQPLLVSSHADAAVLVLFAQVLRSATETCAATPVQQKVK